MVSISRAAPEASKICKVAAMISGPMPSPCATVMGVLLDIGKPKHIGLRRWAQPRGAGTLPAQASEARLSSFYIFGSPGGAGLQACAGSPESAIRRPKLASAGALQDAVVIGIVEDHYSGGRLQDPIRSSRISGPTFQLPRP